MPALWFSSAGWAHSALVLGLAALIDRLVGDPWHWPHPVQAMGWLIAQGSRGLLAVLDSPLTQRLGGVVLGLGLVGGSGLMGWGLGGLCRSLWPPLGLAVEVALLGSCFAGRSLALAAYDVLEPLETGNLVTARQRLSRYVGRDTASLDAPEIYRAALETVAENATDGVTAPLFYALVGALVPGLGPLPLALAYKAASTLDSMVGYRRAPYTDLGWFSARSEDLFTWLPCRLTVLTVALLSGRPRWVWHICCRDGPADPSPNAGWSEAAYAAALGVRLGGLNSYQGQPQRKPYLGEPLRPIQRPVIEAALALTRHTFLLWLILGMGSLVGLNSASI